MGWAEYVWWLLSVDCCGLGAIGQLFLVNSCKLVGYLMLVAIGQLLKVGCCGLCHYVSVGCYGLIVVN